MTVNINHDLRVLDGKTMYMPKWVGGEVGWGNLELPDVYALDTTQKYPLGTKFVDADRTFHYGYCYAKNSASGRASGGMKNNAKVKETTTDALIEPIGETEIVIEDTTSTVNQWAGGFYLPYAHPGLCTYRILSNTVSDGEHVTLTLERGLLVASSSGMTIRISQNMYSKLSCELPNAGLHYASSMGVNLVEAEAGKWLWIQTWGPCYVHGGDELGGKASAERMQFFHIDGSLMCPADFGVWMQPAGYLIDQTDASTSGWFVFLQLAS